MFFSVLDGFGCALVQATRKWIDQDMGKANEMLHETVQGPCDVTQECDDVDINEAEDRRVREKFLNAVQCNRSFSRSPESINDFDGGGSNNGRKHQV